MDNCFVCDIKRNNNNNNKKPSNGKVLFYFVFVFFWFVSSVIKSQESKLTHFQGNGSAVLIYRAISKRTFLENVKNYIYVCLILPYGTDMLAWVGSVSTLVLEGHDAWGPQGFAPTHPPLPSAPPGTGKS